MTSLLHEQIKKAVWKELFECKKFFNYISTICIFLYFYQREIKFLEIDRKKVPRHLHEF